MEDNLIARMLSASSVFSAAGSEARCHLWQGVTRGKVSPVTDPPGSTGARRSPPRRSNSDNSNNATILIYFDIFWHISKWPRYTQRPMLGKGVPMRRLHIMWCFKISMRARGGGASSSPRSWRTSFAGSWQRPTRATSLCQRRSALASAAARAAAKAAGGKSKYGI